ncbi:MAG: peptidylprolyl isomerase [Algoriphagus sp.]|uniref:peptidylprolyl isomerase n=1 Tax=Algoriphagus sp. TaxID=1872435 RepID=UPI00182C9A40|nr:peptidylprolyl isomerase [Algoriphagus sp.]NVJ86717.1 peptidylprolyl isomerase [Algoriphagus sp.]
MIYRSFSALLFNLAVAFTLLGATIQASIAQNKPLLTVGNQEISLNEFIYLVGKGINSEGNAGALSREEFEDNLELFINYKLKVTEAEAQGLHQTTEFQREFESFKEQLKAPYLIKNSLEEGELRKAYSRMQEVIRASHILLRFPPNASADDSIAVLKMAIKLKGDIQNGASINDLAVEYSEDPSAKSNRGDLGYFTALQMVQPFEDAAYMLQSGEVSDPVLTSFGYHIIQVQDRRANPGQVQVSHILVRVDESDTLAEDRARRKISDIYTEIQKPTTQWEEIVSNYSEDPGTNQKGGLLPWFSVGNMIPEFEMAAFSLTEEGEVSPPVKTRFGYHILRLEGKKPMDSFEQMEPMIRSRILRDSRSSMIHSQELAIQKSRYGFQENVEMVSNLEQALNPISPNNFETEIDNNGWRSEFLFEAGSKAYQVEDFLKFVQEQEQPLNSTGKNFDLWFDRFASYVLADLEEKDLASNNLEYQMLLKEYRDGILLFSLMNEEVWQKGIQDSLGQKQYFENHQKNYFWKERSEALIVKVLDMNRLAAAKNSLQNQSYSEELVSNFRTNFEENTPLAFQMQSGIIEIPEHPVLSKVDLSQKYQELEIDGHLHLVLLGEKFPEGPKKFEETRGLVIRDYQEYLDEQLIQSLRGKYPVQINEEVKEEAFIALNQ